MNPTLKMASVAAVVVAVVVAGCSGGTGAVSPSLKVTPSLVVSPSVTPSVSPQAVRITVAGTEQNGSLLQLTAQVAGGWTLEPNGTYRGSSEPPAGAGLFVSLVDNTFSDPCSHNSQRSPKIGSTVEAFATALGEVPNTTATKPVQTTIAGQAATYVELAIPASLPCAPNQFYLWQDPTNGDWWAQGLNETIRIWILEVGGRRVAIATRTWPGTSQEAKTERQAILGSIVFDVTPTQPSTSPAAS